MGENASKAVAVWQKLPTCGFGYFCGEPATHRVFWAGAVLGDWLYLCDRHAREVEESEAAEAAAGGAPRPDHEIGG